MYESVKKGLPIKYILSILILFLSLFYSSMTGYFFISLLMYFFVGVYLNSLREKRELVLYSIILVLVFQNFLIGIGSHLSSNLNGLSYLTQSPLFFVLGIFVSELILKKGSRKLDSTDFLFLILIVIVAISFLFGHGPFNSIFANIRNLTFFYIVYIISKSIFNEEFSINYFTYKIVFLSIFVIIVGIILLFGGYDLYNILGVNEVYFAKGSDLMKLFSGSLDGRFTSDVFGYSVSRMGSLYYEPVNLGYLLVGTYIFSITYNWNCNKIVKSISEVVIVLGIILTFGKGAFMILILSFFAPIIHLTIKNLFRIKTNKSTFYVSIFCICIIFYIFSMYYYSTFGGAVGNHFIAISQTWPNIISQPYGHGIGTGGNAASLFDNSISFDLKTGQETALLSFGYQIGIEGMIFLILIFLSMSNKILEQIDKFSVQNKKNIRMAYIPIILVIISILQDNTYTPQCIAIYMIFVASSKSYIYKLRDVKKMKELQNGDV